MGKKQSNGCRSSKSHRDLQDLQQHGKEVVRSEGKEMVKPDGEMEKVLQSYIAFVLPKACSAFSYLPHYSFIFSNLFCSSDLCSSVVK